MLNSSTLRAGARDDVDIRASRYISGVYLRMMSGVLVTALVAYTLVVTNTLEHMLAVAGGAVTWGIFLLQLGTVLMFRPAMQSASPAKAQGLFYFYAAITGVTVGFVGLVYPASSIMNAFVAAAFAFGGLAAFGHSTGRNLSTVGTFCIQALWMTIGLSLLYALGGFIPFLRPFMESLNITTAILGIAVFSGLTAYESQLLKRNAYSLANSNATESMIGMYTTAGALTMYLNFINLFFSILRLFGGGGGRR